MSIVKSSSPKIHTQRNTWMLFETLSVYVGLLLMITFSWMADQTALLVVGITLQGFWLQRVYCVGHESAHRKLFRHRGVNDALGQLFLWLILVPLPVFRKIHEFHHSQNRRDERTSALDIYTLKANAGPLAYLWAKTLWYSAIGLGGWFLHSLVSIIFFLILPMSMARRVSPAFRGWSEAQRCWSILMFMLPVWGHVLWIQHDVNQWAILFGYPFLVFAWVYSVQLYVYHYECTIGLKTQFHARRLTGPRALGWWLLNLNQHDTHHRKTKIPWYDLPHRGKPLPNDYAANQNVHQFWRGVVQQFRGPTIIVDQTEPSVSTDPLRRQVEP
jgi:fatty acid desaturase